MRNSSFRGYWSEMGYNPHDVFVLLHQRRRPVVGNPMKKPSMKGK